MRRERDGFGTSLALAVLLGFSQLICCNNQLIVAAVQSGSEVDGGNSDVPNGSSLHDPNQASSSNTNLLLTVGNDGFTQQACLEALTRVMAHAGDSDSMSDAQKIETSFAILNAAVRHYPEQPSTTICKIIISNIRQESDFQPHNISGERDGSGDAYGLLQISPFGDSLELDLFKQHADVAGLVDYRSKQPLAVAALQPNDLFDPWVNIHVASWIQSNLGRSKSADPTDWGVKDGPRDASYLTALGSWVAGPATGDASGYGNSGDDISAPYFKSILLELNTLNGTQWTTNDLNKISLEARPVRFKP